MLNHWLDFAEAFVQKLNMWDFFMIKLGLFSAGVAAGSALPPKHRRPVAFAAGLVFAGACLPLMAKFMGSLLSSRKE